MWTISLPPPSPLAPVKSTMETFWYWLTQVHLEMAVKMERMTAYSSKYISGSSYPDHFVSAAGSEPSFSGMPVNAEHRSVVSREPLQSPTWHSCVPQLHARVDNRQQHQQLLQHQHRQTSTSASTTPAASGAIQHMALSTC